MKKIIIYILSFVLICFAIPIIFTQQFKNELVDSNNKSENVVVQHNIFKEYDYKQYTNINLLHAKTKHIENIKLDDYLYGVVSAEMPADFEMEALKAQSVVARTYTIYKIVNNNNKHEGASICDEASCCQAWISKEDRLAKWEESVRESNWNKIVKAVNETAGKIITYENKPINAFFHSNSGGTTEIPINVWGGSGYPYLQVVKTSGEDMYKQYSSEVVLSKQELINKLKEKYSNINIDFNQANCISVTEKTDSGRVRTVKFGNINVSGVETRTILGLKSTNFNISIEGDNVKFSVIGYGHGVGMSQTGADSMAKKGSSFEEIIKHFYVGVEIVNM